MSAHIHVHLNHNHAILFGRVARDIGNALDWITGPGMSNQERLERAKAETLYSKQGFGVL